MFFLNYISKLVILVLLSSPLYLFLAVAAAAETLPLFHVASAAVRT